ncbi:hypothetical protein GCM10009601_49810 [Streptomyces thermospinosisporus]|uniref:Uncharacterized protein n=1 Tax=Streptomyces thermospinosisporus TaxID=161482 RepID=A0ABP4JXR8_9ACTN
MAPASGGTVTVLWPQQGGESAGLGAGSTSGRWMPLPRVWALRGALGPVCPGRAHHTAVAFVVGPLLGHEEMGGSGADAVDPGLLVDLLIDQVLGGVL